MLDLGSDAVDAEARERLLPGRAVRLSRKHPEIHGRLQHTGSDFRGPKGHAVRVTSPQYRQSRS